MSDVIKIDTGANLFGTETIVEPLPLYDDHHPMLNVKMPEHTSPLPNVQMTKLVKRLKLTKKMYGGIGLSANQCGIAQRVFVIGYEDFDMVCINPKVLNVSADLLKENEGCLSYPGLYLKIERPKTIQVEFTAENGEIKQMELDGLTARCFLHELDHMNGKKFVEHVGPVSLQMAKKKQDKMIKKLVRLKKHGI